MVLQQPVGIAVLVTPWNPPAAIATRKAGPVFRSWDHVSAKCERHRTDQLGEDLGRALEEVHQRGEPSAGHGPVDRAVVDGERQGHHLSRYDSAVGDDRLVPDRTDSQDRGCGGLMIAANSSTPYIPRLDTEIEPPSSSSCLSFPSRARLGETRGSTPPRAVTDE